MFCQLWSNVEHCLTRMLFFNFYFTWLRDERYRCWIDQRSRSCFPVGAERTITSHYVGLGLLSGSSLPLAWLSSRGFVGRGVTSGSEATELNSCGCWPRVKTNWRFIHRNLNLKFWKLFPCSHSGIFVCECQIHMCISQVWAGCFLTWNLSPCC